MVRELFFEELRRESGQCIVRIEALKKLSPQQLNAVTPAHPWSIAQQCDHMIISHGGVLDQIESLAPGLAVAQDREFNHSWIGRQIIRGAGPSGNVPVPKGAAPRSGALPPQVVETAFGQAQRFRALVQALDGKAVESARVQSPLSRLIRYSVADALAIISAHSERHLLQIEAIRHHPEFPTV